MTGLINTTVAGLTFRQLFTRNRLVASALFAAAPLLITLFFLLTAHAADPSGVQFLRELYSGIVAFVLLPLAAVVFGTAAFGGEIDDGTIVYLLVKSLPRWQLVLTKFVVAALSTFAMTFVAILLPRLALGAKPDLTPLLQSFAAGIALGSVLYCAIFVTVGLVSKRALVIGLIYNSGHRDHALPERPGSQVAQRTRVRDDGRGKARCGHARCKSRSGRAQHGLDHGSHHPRWLARARDALAAAVRDGRAIVRGAQLT